MSSPSQSRRGKTSFSHGILQNGMESKRWWCLLARADEMYSELYYKLFRVNLSHNGSTSWSFGGVIETRCNLDLTYFPFDKQKCSLKYENWMYTGNAVELHSDDFSTTDYVTNGEWALEATDTVQELVPSVMGKSTFSTLTFNLYLKRKSYYYVINLMLPCLLMVVLTMMIFWLSPEAGEKVSLGVTVLLSFSVLQLVIADKNPVNSDYLPVISVYVTFVMSICAVSSVLTILLLNLHHHSGNAKVPDILRKIFFGPLARILHVSVEITNNDDPKTSPNVTFRPGMAANGTKADGLESNSPTTQQLLSVLQAIQGDLDFIRNLLELKDSVSAVHSEWRSLARVLDRLFFWMCFLVCLIGSLYWFTRRDTMYN